MTAEEWVLRRGLVAQLQSGEKTLEQIHQELRDYKDPDAAELRHFREREPIISRLIEAASTYDSYLAKELADELKANP